MNYCKKCKEFVLSTENCPQCGSYEVEKASECKVCGEPTLNDYCEDCLKIAKRYIYELAQYLEVTEETAGDLVLAAMESEEENG